MLKKVSQTNIPINIAGKDVLVRVVRHKRARSMRLTVRHRHSLRLTLPVRAALKEACAFLERIKPWIIQKLGEQIDLTHFVHGASFPVLGVMHTLQFTSCNTENISVEGHVFHIMGQEENIPALLYAFLDKKLQAFCHQHSHTYAKQLGVEVLSIRVRNMRTKWGSCSSKRNLGFARQLIFAPEDIVQYICAHEVAHLREMNHGAEFWNHVAALFPAHKAARAWLNKNGKDLWSYGALP